MTKHARLSPSSAHRWLHCPASVLLEANYPNTSSSYADEGTAAHELASRCLETGTNTCYYMGEVFNVNGTNYIFDEEMADNVQQYVDYVRSIGGDLYVEQRLSISQITGEPGAFGTSDAVIIDDDELIIVDLKYGRGIRVDAENNEQLSIYALAALNEFEIVTDLNSVRMVIHQPRVSNISEWVISADELRAFGNSIKPKTEHIATLIKSNIVSDADYQPSEDACRFCRAMADCPGARKRVLTTVADDFVDETQPIAPQIERAPHREMDNNLLGNLLNAVGFIEDWCKAIRAKAEGELFAGHTVPGFKLVEGRRGTRQWNDVSAVEEMMKSMRLKVDEMYDMKLISPTSAEKLHKAGVIGPRQWPKLEELITQSNGKAAVVPISDKRPAINVNAVADEFIDETATA